MGAVLGRIHINLAHKFYKPSVAQIAAFTVYAFTVGHPFNDGNKRTSLAIGDLILLMNGKEAIRSECQFELADLIVDLAAKRVRQNDFISAYLDLLKR